MTSFRVYCCWPIRFAGTFCVQGHSVLKGHSVCRAILCAGPFCVQGHSVCRAILCAGPFCVQGHSVCRVILCCKAVLCVKDILGAGTFCAAGPFCVQGHSVFQSHHTMCRDILLPGTHHSGMVIKEGQRSLSLLQRWALAQVSTVTYCTLYCSSLKN
jgi:hypothetical protein